MVSLGQLDHAEAVRYLGGAGVAMNAGMESLLASCEEEILTAAAPKFLYKIIDLPSSAFLQGEDIRTHLEGCSAAVLFCATLGREVDRRIRVEQVRDMARAVVLDAMASVAIEQVGQKFDAFLTEQYPERYQTFRFSPGYGDYPLAMQRTILTELDAPRKIDLTTNDTFLLVPTKSVTAVTGLSERELPRRTRGCASCNLRETCIYRTRGDHCGS